MDLVRWAERHPSLVRIVDAITVLDGLLRPPFSTWVGEDSVVAVPTLLNGWIYPSLWRSHYWRPGAAHTVDQHTGAR